jgi:rhodanese-related sulfurtransferase
LAARAASRRGIDSGSLEGGIRAWRLAGYPLEVSEPG